MKPIKTLQKFVQRTYHEANTELTTPLHSHGVWSLDVDLADKHLAIEWSPATGFGASSTSDGNYGEGPDEVYGSLEDAQQRVDQLLTTNERTSPSFPVLLSRLRERRGVTQQDLAGKLGVRQATISGLEHRDDLQLSTLQRVVESLGGMIEILAVFPDARYRIAIPSSESSHRREPVGSPSTDVGGLRQRAVSARNRRASNRGIR